MRALPARPSVAPVERLADSDPRLVAARWQEPGATALVVPVPAAEGAIGALRRRHTPSGSAGMPAHVTLIAPFAPASALTADRLRELRAVLEGFAPFSFVLTGVRQFEEIGVVYLAPEPADPFVALTAAVFARFPEHPPFGGRPTTQVPHVTAVSGLETDARAKVATRLEAELPIDAKADRVVLLERDQSLRWVSREVVELTRA